MIPPAPAALTPPASRVIVEWSIAFNVTDPVAWTVESTIWASIVPWIVLPVAAPTPETETPFRAPPESAAPTPNASTWTLVSQLASAVTSPVAVTIESSIWARIVPVMVFVATAAPTETETPPPAPPEPATVPAPPPRMLLDSSLAWRVTPPAVVTTVHPLRISAASVLVIVLTATAPAPDTDTPPPSPPLPAPAPATVTTITSAVELARRLTESAETIEASR